MSATQVETVAARALAVKAEIAAACRACGRDPDEITLIGVAKTKPAALVREACAAGIDHIGENYLQEAAGKIAELADLAITWHYVGHIQSNKTRQIAALFDWVHTIDRRKIAERLSAQCPPGKTLNVLIQVNIDRDPGKGGVLAEDAASLAADLQGLPNLQPRGLMTILAKGADPHASYRSVAQLLARIRTELGLGGAWDTLSMGMSGDMRAAIEAGATQVRIGTALFGARG